MVSFGLIARSFFLALLLTGPASAGELSHYPPAGNVWSRSDYLSFYFAHYNGNRALPHLRKPEQRLLFARIVDESNIEAVLNGPGSDEHKGRHLAMILATMGEIRAAYAYAVLVGEPLEEELTQVQIFILRLLEDTVDLSPPEMRSHAWQTTYLGIVHSLGDQGNRSTEQMARLIETLGQSYPLIRPTLDDAGRIELHSRIAALHAAAKVDSVKAGYARLMSILAD